MSMARRIVEAIESVRKKRRLWSPVTALHSENLTELARIFGTDKYWKHTYMPHYQRHFELLRTRPLALLEIGVGGYEDPREGGDSLRMWKRYFPNARIFGIDVYDKQHQDEARIKTFRGSQTDEDFLRTVVGEIGTVDIVIDDGSHKNADVIATFRLLFPLIGADAIYVVEDLQTSYWSEVDGVVWDGSSDPSAHTSMNFFKTLVDGVNHAEFPAKNYQPTYFDTHIVSMHFYHNLLFVQKGENRDGSNILRRA
jgi:demethylmacrocin O-methyltransferase